VTLPADFLVLSTGIEPAAGHLEVAHQLKVPTATGGFFLEAHQKLKPVETVTEGVFLCGLAHYPKNIPETLAQAQAAAIRAAALLFQEDIQQSEISAVIQEGRCRQCLSCVKACPFGAIMVEVAGAPEIRGELCRGCGVCAAECPVGAIEEHDERELLRSVR